MVVTSTVLVWIATSHFFAQEHFQLLFQVGSHSTCIIHCRRIENVMELCVYGNNNYDSYN